MFKLKRIKLNKIKQWFNRLPRILGGNAFLVFLILFLISLILGGLVFYKYSILIEKEKSEIIETPLLFEEKTLQEVLKIWQTRQKRFEEAGLKEYPNLFRLAP